MIRFLLSCKYLWSVIYYKYIMMSWQGNCDSRLGKHLISIKAEKKHDFLMSLCTKLGTCYSSAMAAVLNTCAPGSRLNWCIGTRCLGLVSWSIESFSQTNSTDPRQHFPLIIHPQHPSMIEKLCKRLSGNY